MEEVEAAIKAAGAAVNLAEINPKAQVLVGELRALAVDALDQAIVDAAKDTAR